jgi:glutathione S-transferase
MKLLNSFVSPFAARVRVAIYAYDLPVDIAPSGQWLANYEKSPDFLKINPIGRVPTLILDDGSALPESGVIVDYLADAFPNAALRPRDPQTAARARLLAHLAELYVQIPANPLFRQFFAPQRDQRQIETAINAMNDGIAYLDHFLDDTKLTAGSTITIADCALAPYLFLFAERMVATFDAPPIIERHPKLAAYWRRLQTEPAVNRVLGEMRTAIASSPLRNLLPAAATVV